LTTTVGVGTDLAYLAGSYARHLRAEGKSPATITNYIGAIQLLDVYLLDQGMPRAVAHVSREHIELFLADLLTRYKATSAHNRFRGLATFFRWLEAEGEIKTSPMARMKPPALPEEVIPVLTEAQLKRVLATCANGKTFEELRDHAILRAFIDSGCRLGEIAGLRIEDIDLDEGTLLVTGKGNRQRKAAIGPKTVRAIDRYLRVRHRKPEAAGWVWLGLKGQMTVSGLGQLVKRRGKEAGIEGLHPHMFRHVSAHRFLSAGGSEGDAMQLHGWRSHQMVKRYAAATATDRALASHARLALNEDL
jgi:site-specific recombinase XerD